MSDDPKREYMPWLAWVGCVVAMVGGFAFCYNAYRYTSRDESQEPVVTNRYAESAIYSGIAALAGGAWALAFGARRYLLPRR